MYCSISIYNSLGSERIQSSKGSNNTYSNMFQMMSVKYRVVGTHSILIYNIKWFNHISDK